MMPARTTTPAVSVLMAVHNGERFLGEAVQSVLDQTFTDFELVIVDDASTDGSSAILDSYADPRLVRIRNDQNLGLTRSLNLGLSRCRGPLVARFDADDVCEPDRFRRQVEVLAREPRTTVLGCLTRHIDESGRVVVDHSYCGEPGFLKWDLARWNPVFHPTVMMRKDRLLAVGGYDESFRYAQDYDLFTRLVMAGDDVRLIEEPLLRFRDSAGSITKTKRPAQAECEMRARRKYVAWLLHRPVADEALAAARRLMSWESLPPEGLPRPLVRDGLALLMACRRAVRPGASARERYEIDHTMLRLLEPRARALLKTDPIAAASVAGVLGRLEGGRRLAIGLLASAGRAGLGRWRMGLATAAGPSERRRT